MRLPMRLASNHAVMGERVSGGLSRALGWTATAVMTVAAVALLGSLLHRA